MLHALNKLLPGRAADGLFEVFSTPLAIGVDQTEPPLPAGMDLDGEWPEVLHRRCVIA